MVGHLPPPLPSQQKNVQNAMNPTNFYVFSPKMTKYTFVEEKFRDDGISFTIQQWNTKVVMFFEIEQIPRVETVTRVGELAEAYAESMEQPAFLHCKLLRSLNMLPSFAHFLEAVRILMRGRSRMKTHLLGTIIESPSVTTLVRQAYDLLLRLYTPIRPVLLSSSIDEIEQFRISHREMT